ncbi:MAG: tetratricopeptide repeat protein [Desulfococcaceae bacterium]
METPEQLFHTAMQYHQAGKLAEAEVCYKKILAAAPNHPDALHLLGVIAFQVGKNDIAVNLISKAVQVNPQNPLYYNNLGSALKNLGQTDQALACYQKAVALKPDYADAYLNMGITCKDKGLPDQAIACYQKAIAVRPAYAEAWQNMGAVLAAQGKANEALTCYQKALGIRPEYPEVLNNMGIILKEQHRFEESLSCFHKALALKPAYAEAHNNMGNVYKEIGKADEAAACYQKSIALKPNDADAHINLGIIFQEKGDTDSAIQCYRKALEKDAEKPEAVSYLSQQLQQICQWQEHRQLTEKLDHFTRLALDKGIRPAERAFESITRCADSKLNLEISRAWSQAAAKAVSDVPVNFSFAHRKEQKKKIVIGYVSNDFRDHPVAHLIASLFRLHSRDQFEIFCYSYGKDDASSYRHRVQADCDRFTDIRGLSHMDAAKQIYNDQADILIDLMGHTAGTRLEIFAQRPAPVQVTWLGYPGTTGADFFDYIVTDRIVTPESDLLYYTENPVYMPHCYQIDDNTQPISEKQWTKKELELPEDDFVFCSFNQNYKIEPVIFNTWMNILKKVPNSILWLLESKKSARENLLREAEKRGVQSQRLVFGKRLPKAEHLKRISYADLALDTRIVNGHTTTSDALWAGVPVITILGNHFASRVSASILTAIGLPELITPNIAQYEDLAVRLASDRNELKKIRQKLAANLVKEPLFDTPRFVRNLEWAYMKMWEIFKSGQKPCRIDVRER